MIVWTLVWSNKGSSHSLTQTGSGRCKTKYHCPVSFQDIQRKTSKKFSDFVKRQDISSEVLKTVWRQEGLDKLTAGANGTTLLLRNWLGVRCNLATLWPMDLSLCCRKVKIFFHNSVWQKISNIHFL